MSPCAPSASTSGVASTSAPDNPNTSAFGVSRTSTEPAPDDQDTSGVANTSAPDDPNTSASGVPRTTTESAPDGPSTSAIDDSGDGADEISSSRCPPHPGLAEAQCILNELSPQPKLSKARPRTRKCESAAVVTSSPFKRLLVEKAEKKRGKRKANVTKQKHPYTGETAAKKCKKSGRPKKVASSCMGSDTTPCCICTIRYCDPPFDSWQQCPKCSKWYHSSCGPEDTAICYDCLN